MASAWASRLAFVARSYSLLGFMLCLETLLIFCLLEGVIYRLETLTYCDFPSEHWTRIRTNNVIERLNREIRRRTRVVGTFPDGNSALMLVCARLCHVAGTQWGNKKYMNMKHLEAALDDAFIAG